MRLDKSWPELVEETYWDLDGVIGDWDNDGTFDRTSRKTVERALYTLHQVKNKLEMDEAYGKENSSSPRVS